MATLEDLRAITPIDTPTDDQQMSLEELTSERSGAQPDQTALEKLIQSGPLKALIGTGQELSEFLTGIPRLAGLDVRAPKIVETGIPEKLGAGAIEYMLGGGALKAIPALQKGIGLAREIPAIGRALAAPMTQRAAGAAAMGAIGEPEQPLRGAAMGAAISPAIEAGFKVPENAVSFMTKSKWSPFHYMMMPHIRREFNEFIGNTGKKLGITTEHDVDRALYDRLNTKYTGLEEEAGKLYDSASDLLEDVPYPIENIKKTFTKEKDLYSGSADAMDRKASRVLGILEEKINNPGTFQRALHKEQGQAYKTGNFDLIDSLKNIKNIFNKDLKDFAETKEAPAQLKEGLGLLKEADTFFKENVVPFRERGSAKLQYGKRKPILTEFFKSHSADTSKGLSNRISSKIQDLEHMEKISPEVKEYLQFNHLKEGFNNPESFIKNFSKLTKDQKDSIFSKSQIDRFNKFQKIYDKNPKAFQEATWKSKVLSPGAAAGFTALSSVLPFPLATPLAAAGLTGLGTLKGLSTIPGIREAYISGARGLPTTGRDTARDILIGSLLGTTRGD